MPADSDSEFDEPFKGFDNYNILNQNDMNITADCTQNLLNDPEDIATVQQGIAEQNIPIVEIDNENVGGEGEQNSPIVN